MDVMIDIESIGDSGTVGVPVVSLGAVAFDPKEDVIFKGFYARIDLISACSHSTGISPKTLQWWFAQDHRAIAATFTDLIVPAVSSLDALSGFYKFCKSVKAKRVWAKPVSYDCVQLRAAFSHTMGGTYPFHYRDEICLSQLLKVMAIRYGDGIFNKIHTGVSGRVQDLKLSTVLDCNDLTETMMDVGHVAHNALCDAAEQAFIVQNCFRYLAK